MLLFKIFKSQRQNLPSTVPKTFSYLLAESCSRHGGN